MNRIPPNVRRGMLFRADLVEVIRRNPSATQRVLAEKMGAKLATINKHIVRLEELGVVERLHKQFVVRTDEA